MSDKLQTHTFLLGQASPGTPALGRVMARRDMAAFATTYAATEDECLVLLDFQRIPETNSSYVERSYFWAMDAGRAFAGEDERSLLYLSGTEDAIVPAPIFPIAVHCSVAVIEEIEASSSKTKRIAMVARTDENPRDIKLIGDLERSLRETLDRLSQSDGMTATELHEVTQRRGTSGARDVGVNVWHNRLTALYRLRLASRTKDGRFWRYQSIAERVTHG